MVEKFQLPQSLPQCQLMMLADVAIANKGKLQEQVATEALQLAAGLSADHMPDGELRRLTDLLMKFYELGHSEVIDFVKQDSGMCPVCEALSKVIDQR